jgi:hypothetical protein
LPDLWPENDIPLKIFMRVRYQHIMGPGGPVALAHEPVFRWFEKYGVSTEDEDFCFDLVMAAYDEQMIFIKRKQGNDKGFNGQTW